MRRSLLGAIVLLAACSSRTEELVGPDSGVPPQPVDPDCKLDPDPPIITPGVLEVELSNAQPRDAWVVIGDADGKLETYLPIREGEVLSFDRDALSTAMLVLLDHDGSCYFANGAEAVRPGERVRFFSTGGTVPSPVPALLRAILPAAPEGTERVWVSACGKGIFPTAAETAVFSEQCLIDAGGANVFAVARDARGNLLGHTRLEQIAIAEGQEVEVRLPPYDSSRSIHTLELTNFPAETSRTEILAWNAHPSTEIADFFNYTIPGARPPRLELTVPPWGVAPNLNFLLTVGRGIIWYTLSAPSFPELPGNYDFGGNFPAVGAVTASADDRVTLNWELDGEGCADGFVATVDRMRVISRRFISSYTFPEMPPALSACAPQLPSNAFIGVEIFGAESQRVFLEIQLSGFEVLSRKPSSGLIDYSR